MKFVTSRHFFPFYKIYRFGVQIGWWRMWMHPKKSFLWFVISFGVVVDWYYWDIGFVWVFFLFFFPPCICFFSCNITPFLYIYIVCGGFLHCYGFLLVMRSCLWGHVESHNQNQLQGYTDMYIGFVFGAIFFFPGWHKLIHSDWLSGNMLMHTIDWKRVQYCMVK